LADVTCPNCGHQVPEGTWCIRCGHALDGAARARPGAGFAAAPNERAGSPRIVSTLFPQLPKADMDAFRLALGVGVAGVVALSAARLFPVAVIAAALLVPLLTVVYLYDVDVYEDQPFRVVAFTLAWGAVAGVAIGLLADAVTTSGPDLAVQKESQDVLLRGVVFPLAAVALTLAGPLVLLPYRKFNDVLDGVTFGAACAVAFTSAQVITTSASLLEGGLRQDGEIVPWIARTLAMAAAQPVLAMAAVGAAAGAWWLRYRAPVKDRKALGILGNPIVATLLAAGLVVLGAIGQPLLPIGWWLAELVVLDVLALLWLRRTIHIGLLQESEEIEVGPEIECPNCGARTAKHSFCSNCGIALAALPKRAGEGPGPAGPSPAGGAA
jgi:ribosomal protein L32/RsiW-degrading membrane proteinase PrsW (M82 family)